MLSKSQDLRYNNLLIKANSIDHRNDCIITAFNLLTIIFTLNNIYFVDGIVGIGISLWMIITAISIFLESYDVLMDKAISTEIKEEVTEIKIDTTSLNINILIPIKIYSIIICLISIHSTLLSSFSL